LIMAGWPADLVLQVAGVRIAGAEGVGGRIPDLTVWKKAPPRACGWRYPALRVPKPHPRRSGGVFVLVDDAAEAVTSPDG
jgi:hypothetical protein